MINFRRTILYFILIVLGSCDLDIPYQDEISGKDVIDNVGVLRELLNSAYISYPKEDIYLSILAGDLQPTYLVSRDNNIKELYNWNANQIQLFSERLWNSYYNTIAKINDVLTSAQNINTSSEADGIILEQIKGECFGLKALVYFDLLMFYAERLTNQNSDGIILKDNFSLDYLRRSSVGESINQIKILIDKGKKLLKDKEYNVYYISYNAMLALELKLSLYTGNYKNAIDAGMEIIEKLETTTDKDYINLFYAASSSEKIFAFNNIEKFLLYDIIDSKETGDYFEINANVQYSPQDIRNSVTVLPFQMRKNGYEDLVERRLLGKYRISTDDYMPRDINKIRIAEVYFDLAEALVKDNKVKKAISVMNIYLQTRNSESVLPDESEVMLMKRVEKERIKEFVGEGKLYYEYKRNNCELNIYKIDSNHVNNTINSSDYRWLLPIPIEELKQNKNCKQNPKWRNIIN